MDNNQFLDVLKKSFDAFVKSGTSRSTKKLKPLHGAIAEDLAKRLGERYTIVSQGYNIDSEEKITGRYMDKDVDITILKDNCVVAGVAVKFVMQNYAQNSINYFENMLGETANIRCANIPYFQIFIVFDKMPYYKIAEKGKPKHFDHWEEFTTHNLKKYCILDNDSPTQYMHTPDKMLIYVVHKPIPTSFYTPTDYCNYYKENPNYCITLNDNFHTSSKQIIMNDYVTFIEKVVHLILGQ